MRSLKDLEVALVLVLCLEFLGDLGCDVDAWHSVFLGGDTPLAVVDDESRLTDSLPLVGHDLAVLVKQWDFPRADGLVTVLDFAGVQQEFSDALLAVSVALAPLLSVPPRAHNPLTVLYAPWLAVALTYVNPPGSTSLTCTPVALLGP